MSSSSIGITNLAITNDVGENPEASEIRTPGAAGCLQPSAVSVLQTLTGHRPFADTMSELSRFGKNSIGAKARFAGMHGEAPLNQFVRTL